MNGVQTSDSDPLLFRGLLSRTNEFGPKVIIPFHYSGDEEERELLNLSRLFITFEIRGDK